MKKYHLFIAAILAVCICSALACSSVHKTETTPTAQPTAQPTEWQAGHQVPPDSIEFRSVEEMQAFFASVKLDESKVESYIEERGIRRCCGVRNKAELSDLLERFDRIPFPTHPKYKPHYMDYYPTFGRFTLVYLFDKGHGYFTIYEGLSADSETLLNGKIKSKDVTQIIPTGSDKIRRLYIVNDTDVSDDAVTFWADIDGFLVEILTVYNSRSEAVEIVQSFDFGKMSEVVNSITSE